MSEPRKVEITALNGQKLIVTEREIVDKKSGKTSTYMSFSNGMDVAGVYITDKVKKELIDFMKPSKRSKDDE